MILDSGLIVAILIAVLSPLLLMCSFWRENISLQKQIIHMKDTWVEKPF